MADGFFSGAAAAVAAQLAGAGAFSPGVGKADGPEPGAAIAAAAGVIAGSSGLMRFPAAFPIAPIGVEGEAKTAPGRAAYGDGAPPT
jgi:hypothetical protein